MINVTLIGNGWLTGCDLSHKSSQTTRVMAALIKSIDNVADVVGNATRPPHTTVHN